MNNEARNKGFTSDYLEYCKENGFENNPQAMLALDKQRYPSNSSKLQYGSATGFIVWRGNRINHGQQVELPDINDHGRVGTLATESNIKSKPIQSSIFDLL